MQFMLVSIYDQLVDHGATLALSSGSLKEYLTVYSENNDIIMHNTTPQGYLMRNGSNGIQVLWYAWDQL